MEAPYDILDDDNEAMIYWSDEDTNSSDPLNDDLLSSSDESSRAPSVASNEDSHPPSPLHIDQQEGAEGDVLAPVLDPEEEEEDVEYPLDYSSEFESEDENEEDEEPPQVQGEELPQEVEDPQSSDDEEEDNQGMPPHGDVPDLRAFDIFGPLVDRPCVDDEGRELPQDVFRDILATWYFPSGSAYQGSRHSETKTQSLATEKLLSQQCDYLRCIYCNRPQCARTRHYLMSVFLCNIREAQDAATNNSVPGAKGLEETAGIFVHSARDCHCIPAPFVDCGGRNIGKLSHRIFCVKKYKSDLVRIAKDRLDVEINPYQLEVRKAAKKVALNSVDLTKCLEVNRDALARMFVKYKKDLHSANQEHGHGSRNDEDVDHEIPNASRHIID